MNDTTKWLSELFLEQPITAELPPGADVTAVTMVPAPSEFPSGDVKVCDAEGPHPDIVRPLAVLGARKFVDGGWAWVVLPADTNQYVGEFLENCIADGRYCCGCWAYLVQTPEVAS